MQMVLARCFKMLFHRNMYSNVELTVGFRFCLEGLDLYFG